MAQPRILLAEDSLASAMFIRALFEVAGHNVSLVGSGQEAVEASTVQPFDLILMNVEMPMMDGHAAIRAIRSAEVVTGRRPSRIYTISSHSSPDGVRAALEAGADRHLTKPLHPGMLLAALESVRTHWQEVRLAS